MIIYEQPLNEITRILLKIEYLLLMCDHNLQRSERWDTHQVLVAICDILNLLDRPDLRSKLTKEVQRYISILEKLRSSPDINQAKLSILLHRLEITNKQLLHYNGRLAQNLRDDEFLNGIRQHLMNPAGTTGFDIPLYHYWSMQSNQVRQSMVQAWHNKLQDVRELKTVLLELIRDSSDFSAQQANNGFYQMNIDPHAHCQLLRVKLNSSYTVYPEISAGRHRLCIYFMQADYQKRPQQHNDVVNFDLAVCIL